MSGITNRKITKSSPRIQWILEHYGVIYTWWIRAQSHDLKRELLQEIDDEWREVQ